MKFIFEPGDKFYKQDYADGIFAGIRENAEAFCAKENLKLLGGEDIKGEYIVVVKRSEYEDMMDALRARRIDELKSIREDLEYNAVEYDGVFYDVDEISLMRLYGVAETMRADADMKIDIRDADNYVRINCGIDVVEGIIVAYAKRSIALNECYNKIKREIMQAADAQGVNSVSTDAMFMVD